MRRVLAAAIMGLLITSSSVFADDEEGASTLTPAAAVATTTLVQRPDLASTLNLAPQSRAPRRPLALSVLYAGSGLLQGYDVYSTLNALKSGAGEANPLMRGITRSPAAFVALKAGITAASIVGTERMWKDDHRIAAVMMMIASNSMMAAVAAHNSSVLQHMK